MQNIPRDQLRFLEEKGSTGKHTAKILSLALKYFSEENESYFCEFNLRGSFINGQGFKLLFKLLYSLQLLSRCNLSS